MTFDVTVYYFEEAPDTFYSVNTLDILPNGFFRIINHDGTTIINPNTVEKIEATEPEEE